MNVATSKPRILSVASTTDTQEDVNRVAGVEAEKSKEDPKTERPAGEATRPEGGGEGGAPARTEAPAAPPSGKTRYQERIDRLTGRNYDLANELSRERKRSEELERQLAARREEPKGGEKREESAAASDPKPVQANFKTMDEYFEALADWKIRQQRATDNAAAMRQADTARLQEVLDGYNRRMTEFKREHPDFTKVVGAAGGDVPRAVSLAIMEMENGPAVAYYLAQHEDLVDELVEMSDLQAIGEVWRVSDYLEAQAAGKLGGKGKGKDKEKSGQEVDDELEETAAARGEEVEEEEEAPAAPPARRARPATAAPEPIRTVARAGAAASTLRADEVDYREYKRRRRAGQI